MSRSHLFSLSIGTLLVLSFWSGCAKQDSAPSGAAEAKIEAQADDEIATALAQLENPADREAAKQQVICPVSDHALGSMGPPLKASHEGKHVFLCCEGCKDQFDKDPATYLAKAQK